MVAPNLALADTSLDLYLGVAITQDEDVTIRDDFGQIKVEPDWDDALAGGARLGSWPSDLPWLGIAGDVSYYQTESNQADLDVFIASALVMLRYPEGQFHPYIGAGPGLFYSKLDLGGGDYSDEQVNVGIDAKAGLSIDITDKIATFSEYRFTYFNPEYDDNFTGTNVEIETDVYTHYILFGISFRF